MASLSTVRKVKSFTTLPKPSRDSLQAIPLERVWEMVLLLMEKKDRNSTTLLKLKPNRDLLQATQ